MRIKVKYHNPNIEKLKYVGDKKSNWIDLRAAETVALKKGETKRISLGVSMRLPDGYEAHIVPRSSTFDSWGVLQTNSMGVIDNTYSGDNDIWKFEALAMRDTEIKEGDRICQFRLFPIMGHVDLSEVNYLDGPDRGGFGSTGTR